MVGPEEKPERVDSKNANAASASFVDGISDLAEAFTGGSLPEVSARARKELKEGLEALALIAFGVLFYCLVERKACVAEESASCECGNKDHVELFGECSEPWTVTDSLYFTLVTISTVGYGDFAPTTVEGQVFTVLFCFVGIIFIFSELADLVGGAMHPLYSAAQRKMDSMFPPKTIDLQGDGTADIIIPRSAPIFYASRLAAPISVVVVLQVVSAFVFQSLVPEWTLWQAFYHCLITATTVGYGDMFISTEDGRLFACAHLMLSVCLLAALISEVGKVQATRAGMVERVERVRKQLDRDLILSLDKDQNGLDKFEFVTGMLVKLELVPEEEVTSFVELFEFLDADGSGQLTKKELNQMVDQWQKQFAASADGLTRSKSTAARVAPAPLASPSTHRSACSEAEAEPWREASGAQHTPPAAPTSLPTAVATP